MYFKELLSALAIAFTLIAFYPYIKSIHHGTTRPHVFSWIIWGSTTFVVFLAQLADGGGVGTWAVGLSGVITLYVAWLAYRKKTDVSITRPDYLFLCSALTAIPIWYITADPLWAVVILTTIDMLGFGPTFRKAYHQPFGERLHLYVLMGLRSLVVIAALEHYSVTTVLFPASIAIACLTFIVMVTHRRRRESTAQ